MKKDALVFNIFVELSSQLCECFNFRELIFLSLSLVVILLNFTLVKGLLDIFYK